MIVGQLIFCYGTGVPASSELAILIPCHDEEKSVVETIRDFRSHFPEAAIVVCDNASHDGTARVAAAAGAAVLTEPRKGKGYAVRALFTRVSAERYILVDGDHTYRAEDARRLLDVVVRGEAEMAVGDRLSGGDYARTDRRLFHNIGNRLVSGLITRFFHVPVRDSLSGLRAMSARYVRTIPLISTGFEIETELTLQAIDKGFGMKEIPIRYYDRPRDNPSKLHTLTDGSRILLTFLRFLLYFQPLGLSLGLSALFFLGSLLLGAGPVIEYMEFEYVYKVPSLIVATGFFLISLITFFLGFVFESMRYARTENFLLLMKAFQHGRETPDR